MEFELWWLLAIPVFFSLGWIAARIDIRHVVRESRTLPRSYFQGLNYLLLEQQDRAVESFIEATREDPQALDLQFALGALFRRRGESDRAIRMHQSLIERDDLKPERRLDALSELGQDYLKAGLLDRAEEVFQKLLDTARHEDALKYLLEIYQQEKEWKKAIAIADRLPDHASVLWQKQVANFYCEIAASALTHSRPADARAALDAALNENRKCVRASILLGDLYAQEQKYPAAIEAWKRVEQQNPIYLALVAGRLMEAHQKLGRDAEGLQLLRGYLEGNPSLDLLDAVFAAELADGGAPAALALVREELQRNATLLGLGKLLEAQTMLAPPDVRADLELTKGIIHNHTRRVARYRCDACGFKARQFYWRCPGCGGWETYPPKRTEEFDLTP
ncbi:MAG: lipopolysaccharide assembly protein LapB [Rhodocyclaceae bacterium]|nr:lipopolysaccharide assembly protein LapB [Rhodocyclaceae bacterium]MBX3670258.1 lipopolysaccharide assembly protein LapB [Rhodocyclaceae bacterium]